MGRPAGRSLLHFRSLRVWGTVVDQGRWGLGSLSLAGGVGVWFLLVRVGGLCEMGGARGWLFGGVVCVGE